MDSVSIELAKSIVVNFYGNHAFEPFSPSSEPWYEVSRIGVNMIWKLLPSLCAIAKVPRLTNHSIRTTSIRAMRRGGFDGQQVSFVSGHKSLKKFG